MSDETLNTLPADEENAAAENSSALPSAVEAEETAELAQSEEVQPEEEAQPLRPLHHGDQDAVVGMHVHQAGGMVLKCALQLGKGHGEDLLGKTWGTRARCSPLYDRQWGGGCQWEKRGSWAVPGVDRGNK